VGSNSRLLPYDGQPGSNAQVLVNAVTVHVGTRIKMSGTRHITSKSHSRTRPCVAPTTQCKGETCGSSSSMPGAPPPTHLDEDFFRLPTITGTVTDAVHFLWLLFAVHLAPVSKQ
jgi:hypothetical protein